MGVLADIRNNIVNWLLDGFDTAIRERREGIAVRRDYRQGDQPHQLKVKPNQYDDNTTVNLSGLAYSRSVSLMLRGGVEFDLPGEGDTKESLYLDKVYLANRKDILLAGLATLAGEAGTGYLKILPDAQPYMTGGVIEMLPRLVVLDPLWMTITTAPEDIGTITAYTIRFNIPGANGDSIARKQVISINPAPDFEAATWTVEDYEASRATGGRWDQTGKVIWPYYFAPVLHFQNLPDPLNVYGKPDQADDTLWLQDKINQNASNINKIIRFFAHPRRYGKNLGTTPPLMGPDDMPIYNAPEAEIIEMANSADVAGAEMHLQFLRQALMDTTQTFDFSSVGDKLGTLTNFGLRVLTMDAMSRVELKRALFGEALEELNRRLLFMAGMTPDAGDVVWQDPLPSNKTEELTSFEAAQRMGVMSKQTIAQKLGLDWEVEQERLEGERAAQDEGEDAIGERLLRQFTSGVRNNA